VPATTSRAGFFTPEFLAQLERLSLVSRRTFRGSVKGERRSPRRGQSVEFADYRQYGVGDDLRYVDWNVYARSDRLHVKLFVDEEDLCLHLLVDASASMDFGAPVTKLAWAVRLAAALGFVGLAGFERVGVGVLRERVGEGWTPARGRAQIQPMLDFLRAVRPGGRTGLNEGLVDYAKRAREAGVAVLISDLLDPAGWETGVRALLERRFEVHVIHVLAPEEMNPQAGGDLRLVDSETGEARDLSFDGDAVRGYQRRLRDFLAHAEAFCLARELDYHRVVTDTSVEEVVGSRLRGRMLA
jgi:uncharacterized protein (DUF58 family)